MNITDYFYISPRIWRNFFPQENLHKKQQLS